MAYKAIQVELRTLKTEISGTTCFSVCTKDRPKKPVQSNVKAHFNATSAEWSGSITLRSSSQLAIKQ